MKRFIAAAALWALAFGSAYAAAIPGLYNTGIPRSGMIDQNYSLTVIAGDTFSGGAYVSVESDLRGEWLPNSGASRWITPMFNASTSLDPVTNGVYAYSLEFTLTAAEAAGASFLGRYAADNEVAVYLNGQLISSGAGFSDWTMFGASGGFLAGVNGLQFLVTNYALDAGNPTGLRVEFTESSIPSAVPEPHTYAMLLGGLGLLGGVARRKRRA